jgi:hypothetical protein
VEYSDELNSGPAIVSAPAGVLVHPPPELSCCHHHDVVVESDRRDLRKKIRYLGEREVASIGGSATRDPVEVEDHGPVRSHVPQQVTEVPKRVMSGEPAVVKHQKRITYLLSAHDEVAMAEPGHPLLETAFGADHRVDPSCSCLRLKLAELGVLNSDARSALNSFRVLLPCPPR